MILQQDIEVLFRISKFVNPKTNEAIQNYINNEKRLNYIVRFYSNNTITAIWFDIEKLSERDLKFIFKTHKESSKHFFIQYLGGFYRIGFKG